MPSPPNLVATRAAGLAGRRLLLALGAALLAGCEFAPVLPRGEPPPAGAFTLAVLPDTQGYVTNYRWDRALSAQTRWIAENAGAHDIRYVVQLGDVTWYNRTTEWKIARGLFEPFHDGDRVAIPYAIAPGNHDLGPNGMAENRWSLMDQDEFFGPGSPYGQQPTIRGFFDPKSTKNTWHEFEAGGQKWMILALEFGMGDEVLAWANEVVRDHPEHQVIVILHAYLGQWNARFNFQPYGGNQVGNPHAYPLGRTEESVNDGEQIWQKLVRRHANIRLVLCGHSIGDGEGRQASVGDHGQVVHQVLQNYQPFVDGSEFGGQGFFRLLEFWPDGETLRVRSFSPWLGEYIDTPDHDYFLSLARAPVAPSVPEAILADAPLLYYRPQVATGTTLANLAPGRPELDGTYEGDGAGPWAFDGDDALRPAAPLPRLREWSVEAWVRPQIRGSGQIIFTNDRAPVEGPDEDGDPMTPPEFTYHDDVILGIAPEGSTFSEAAYWAVTHRDQDGSRTVAECRRRVVADRWYHVVASADGQRLRLYVDGDLVDEAEAAGPDLDLDAAPILLGRSEHLQGAALRGELAEIAVYERALSASEVVEHQMAGFGRVNAATIELVGALDPDDEELEGVELGRQGYPGLSVTIANRGDFQVFRGGAHLGDPAKGFNVGSPATNGEGVLLATVNDDARAGVVASAEAAWNSWGHGIYGVSLTQVGAAEDLEPPPPPEEDTGTDAPPQTQAPSVRQLLDIELSVVNEVNVATSLVWFPFQGGWRGGHVRADGHLFLGSGVDAAMFRPHPEAGPEGGRVLVDLGPEPGVDGMLLAIGASGKNRVVVAGASPEAPGWEVRIQPNSQPRAGVERPTLAEVLTELEIPEDEWELYEESKLRTWDSFAFVYVPFDAVGLIGGVYDGVEETPEVAVGGGTITRTGPGAYQLEIPGEGADTGVLVLTGADVLDPRNVALTSFTDDLGVLQIRAWEVESAAPRDTTFAWAFVRFAAPPEPHR